MFIAIYNTDHAENKQGDIHSSNVWEYAPMMPYLTKLEVPEELESKVVQVNKVSDLAERWQYQADVVLTQPTLDPHWNLNGSVLFEEPTVSAWVSSSVSGDASGSVEFLYVEPLVDAWVSGSVSGYAQPMITKWIYEDDIQNTPVYILDGEGNSILDERYVETEIEDTNYTLIQIMDESYIETVATNPNAVYYSEEVNDYRYTYLPEAYHWELEEDTEATAALTSEEYDLKIKSIFKACRDKWQSMADNFALENTKLGITAAGKTKEVADAFKDVDYYIRVNSPHEALNSFTTITRDDNFLTEERLTALYNEFNDFLSGLTTT